MAIKVSAVKKIQHVTRWGKKGDFSKKTATGRARRMANAKAIKVLRKLHGSKGVTPARIDLVKKHSA